MKSILLLLCFASMAGKAATSDSYQCTLRISEENVTHSMLFTTNPIGQPKQVVFEGTKAVAYIDASVFILRLTQLDPNDPSRSVAYASARGYNSPSRLTAVLEPLGEQHIASILDCTKQ